MRLKRWESPRRQGRNDKGKGGSARQRGDSHRLSRIVFNSNLVSYIFYCNRFNVSLD
ncbi:MAG: hypothetical protein ACKN87_04440 [Microcystis aeruginosa]